MRLEEITADPAARFTVAGYRGIAFYCYGLDEQEQQGEDFLLCEDDECDHGLSEMCWLAGEWEMVETGMVVMVMVGDDRKHIVDPDDVTLIAEEDYCSGCGQVGCRADGRINDTLAASADAITRTERVVGL